MAHGFMEREAGEDGHPILTSLEVHELPEAVVHPQKISQGRSLIDLPRAGAGVVNFLESDQVWFEFGDNGCDSLQIHPAVHASAVLYVVGYQTYLGRFCCHERMNACEKDTGNGKETGQDSGRATIVHVRA